MDTCKTDLPSSSISRTSSSRSRFTLTLSRLFSRLKRSVRIFPMSGIPSTENAPRDSRTPSKITPPWVLAKAL